MYSILFISKIVIPLGVTFCINSVEHLKYFDFVEYILNLNMIKLDKKCYIITFVEKENI